MYIQLKFNIMISWRIRTFKQFVDNREKVFNEELYKKLDPKRLDDIVKRVNLT